MPKLKKEKWGKPKLIILTRGDSHEKVLSFCKSAFQGSGVASFQGSICKYGTFCPDDCFAYGTS
jgi:hypothetical protein